MVNVNSKFVSKKDYYKSDYFDFIKVEDDYKIYSKGKEYSINGPVSDISFHISCDVDREHFRFLLDLNSDFYYGNWFELV
jgi:hypothetical protein